MSYVDLSTCSESDANNRYTETTTRCDFNAYRNDNNHFVVKDYGTKYFCSYFKHTFTSCATNWQLASGDCVVIYMLANTLNDRSYQTNNTFISVYFYRSAANYYIYLDCGGSADNTDISAHSTIPYYFTIYRNCADVELKIYSDSSRTILVDTLNVTMPYNLMLRYFYPCASNYYNLNVYVRGYTENFDINMDNDCGYIKIDSDNYALYWDKPDNITLNDSENVQIYNYEYINDINTFSLGKNTENITLHGFMKSTVTDYSKILQILNDGILDNGEKVTLSGFSNPLFDGSWVVEDFTYKVTGGYTDSFEYDMTLEKA